MKKIFDKKIIGLFTGLIFLVFIVKNLDLNKSVEVVKNFDFYYILLMIPVYCSSFLFRTVRWRIILSKNKKIKFWSLFNYIIRGWTINSFVPARAGEIYRTHMTGKKENVGRMTILASVILERIFDGIVLFLILTFFVSFLSSNKILFGVAVVAGILFTGSFLFLFLTSKAYNNASFREKCFCFGAKIKETGFIKNISTGKFSGIINKISGKSAYALDTFVRGLNIFNFPDLVLKSFLLTVPVWACEALTILLLLKGFGYSVGISGALFVLCIIAFASLIPGGPGSVGPVQHAYIMALGVFNIPGETAFAVSIMNQAFIAGVVSVISLFFIAVEYFTPFVTGSDIPEENSAIGSD